MITRVYINCLSNISDIDQQTRIVYIVVTALQQYLEKFNY